MRHTLLASWIFLLCGTAVAGQPSARILTIEDRVAAQRAIEQVYWNHRIWPKENPGPKPPLSAVMPDAAIRAKVEDDLKKSNALEKWWQRPITAEQLQAELDRMSKETRDGETLLDLFRALNNDPVLIAETLARQTLVDRMIRNWYARDTRFHGELKARAESDLAACTTIDCLKAIGHEVRETTWKLRNDETGPAERNHPNEVSLGAADWKDQAERLATTLRSTSESLPTGHVSGLDETRDAFVATAILSQHQGEIVTASVTWPKRSFEEWWNNERGVLRSNAEQPSGSYTTPAVSVTTCTDDTWGAIPGGAVSGRSGHTAVWTGTEMIVWGGTSLNTGYRYKPATDSWTETSTGLNVPEARGSHTAVWTGTEMIVWGGSNESTLETGGRYNPNTDSWIATPTGAGCPAGRAGHTAVWTGAQMIVWGGWDENQSDLLTGGRYRPFNNTWTPTSTGTFVPAARVLHTAVWVGARMVVWGGQQGATGTKLNTGGRYDPVTNTWSITSTGGSAPEARYGHTAVSTGTEMIIWGGVYSSGSSLNAGARYNVGLDSWTPMSPGPSLAQDHTAVWTGTRMIVWGGFDGHTGVNSGGSYNPATNSWIATSTGANVARGRSHHTAVWTGTEMIIWGGGNEQTGGRYNLTTNSWVPMSTPETLPRARELHTAVWTGAEMIVWGGSDGYYLSSGWRFNPSTSAWTAMPAGPTARIYHTAIWTGKEMIIWGGKIGDPTVYTDTGGRYNPVTNSWLPTSSGANVPLARRNHTAVWTGTQMIIWGGVSASGFDNVPLNTGGRYDPATDAWTTLPLGPAARLGHTAVWTGTEMIVWGGLVHQNLYLNTGGRYNPTTNGWTPTSTGANDPQGRVSHSAVWTGTEMIVWGGGDNVNAGELFPWHQLYTGGRYAPSTDTWTPTSTGANVPGVRAGHSAVWTGTQMIVWGGHNNNVSPQPVVLNLNTGGRYSPATDTWLSTSTGGNVPAARYDHTAVWTGTLMIPWGGTPYKNDGGTYCACTSTLAYRDVDGDGYGDATTVLPSCNESMPAGYVVDNTDCNDAAASTHPGAVEACDGLDNNCNAWIDEDAAGVDSDGDNLRNACDNCDFEWNPNQSDANHDGIGDPCDVNDGLIGLYSTVKDKIEWQQESGFATWNVYEGNMDVLRATGAYTQAPGSNPLANRACGVTDPWVDDVSQPPAGKVKFALVTGVADGFESSLGSNSAGVPRTNANPCP